METAQIEFPTVNFSAIDSLLLFVEEIDEQGPYYRLPQLAEDIKEGFLGYVKAGYCLEKVRKCCLWKKHFRSFKEFCEKSIGKSVSYASRIIEASRVVCLLINSGFTTLPLCESQARPLVKYMECDRAGNSELGEKWQAVIEAANGKAITAELVQRIVDGEPEKQTKRMQIDIEIYQQLEAKAKLAGITVQELLKKLLEGHIPDEDDSESIPEEEEEDAESKEQKLVKWEED